jgi:hypothetical protein
MSFEPGIPFMLVNVNIANFLFSKASLAETSGTVADEGKI